MARPNVLLVVLDSVRARNVSHLGYPRGTTPEIDAFADRATTYRNARAPGIHSMASHVSFFTGYQVAEHRATSHSVTLEPGHTIWEDLSGLNYRTGLFTPNSIVADASNLASFFDHVVGPKRRELLFPDAMGPTDLPGDPSYTEYVRNALTSETPIRGILNGLDRAFGSASALPDPERERGAVYVDEFLEWQSEGEGPWAACLNLMDAHFPYVPQPEYDRWGSDRLRQLHEEATGGPLKTQYLGERPFWELEAFEHLYDGCIRQADAYVGQLLTELERRGLLEDTLVVITSDHGEGFGERSVLNDAVRLIDHSWGIDDELAHVPLIVKYPEQSTPETVRAPATLARFPTVVRAAIDGDRADFIPSDGRALTTTYRVEEPGEGLPPSRAELAPYFGPWHAVCHDTEAGIRVDAIRRDDQVRTAPSAGRGCTVDGEADRALVESVVEAIEPVDVTGETATMDDAVEQRLQELGYMT